MLSCGLAFNSYFCFPLRGVGCIFFEMATGRPMFPGGTVDEQLHLIFKVSTLAKSFIKSCHGTLVVNWLWRCDLNAFFV